jgi:hypothetical protein
MTMQHDESEYLNGETEPEEVNETEQRSDQRQKKLGKLRNIRKTPDTLASSLIYYGSGTDGLTMAGLQTHIAGVCLEALKAVKTSMTNYKDSSNSTSDQEELLEGISNKLDVFSEQIEKLQENLESLENQNQVNNKKATANQGLFQKIASGIARFCEGVSDFFKAGADLLNEFANAESKESIPDKQLQAFYKKLDNMIEHLEKINQLLEKQLGRNATQQSHSKAQTRKEPSVAKNGNHTVDQSANKEEAEGVLNSEEEEIEVRKKQLEENLAKELVTKYGKENKESHCISAKERLSFKIEPHAHGEKSNAFNIIGKNTTKENKPVVYSAVVLPDGQVVSNSGLDLNSLEALNNEISQEQSEERRVTLSSQTSKSSAASEQPVSAGIHLD